MFVPTVYCRSMSVILREQLCAEVLVIVATVNFHEIATGGATGGATGRVARLKQSAAYRQWGSPTRVVLYLQISRCYRHRLVAI
jgi:hypothetical protein